MEGGRGGKERERGPRKKGGDSGKAWCRPITSCIKPGGLCILIYVVLLSSDCIFFLVFCMCVQTLGMGIVMLGTC